MSIPVPLDARDTYHVDNRSQAGEDTSESEVLHPAFLYAGYIKSQ